MQDDGLRTELRNRTFAYSDTVLKSGLIPPVNHNLAEFVRKSASSPLTANNTVKLLLNGEEKFPEVLKALEAAEHHIHLEYYIYEDDATGKSVADILKRKAQQGVEVRFMYDDFGSNGLSKTFIQNLEAAGVQTAPFYKIKILALASRLNYRNHRKILVVDGKTSFVGGINMSDRYRNDRNNEGRRFLARHPFTVNGYSNLIFTIPLFM